MAKTLMQACSSTSGALVAWISEGPDFAGASFPGPGTAVDPAIVAARAEATGGGSGLTSPLSANLDFGGHKGVNAAPPTASSDLTTMGFVAAAIAAIAVSAGIGLQGTSTFSVKPDGTTLSVSGSGVKVSTGGITNNEVSATAGITGGKIVPDFVAQTVKTTDGYVASGATSYYRLGLAAGSGSGVASSASTGGIRFPRGGGDLAKAKGRKDDDLQDIDLVAWNSATATLSLGQTSLMTSVAMQASSSGTCNLATGGVGRLQVSGASIVAGLVNIIVTTCSFDATVPTPFFGQAVNPATNGTGATLTQRSADMSGNGTVVAGAHVLSGGNCTNTGAVTSQTAGDAIVKGGDSSGSSGTRIGANVQVLVGTGSTRKGNLSLVANASGYQSMEGGLFVGNATTAPTGNPTSGGYLYVNAGALTYRGSGGTVTVLAAA